MKPITIHPPGNRNITVKIYRVKDASTASGQAFQVADYTTGKRKLITFADEHKARVKAGEIALQLSRGDLDAITLTNRDKSDYQHARQLLDPLGVALPIAARHYAEAVKILGSDLIVEAAKFYAKRHAKIGANKSVTEVYDLLLADARQRKLSDRYIEDLEHRAGKFSAAFQVGIVSITGDDVRGFLENLTTTRGATSGAKKSRPVSARSHNNYLGAINRLFEFAKARKFLPFDHDELSGIEPMKDSGGDIEIYLPGELTRLLDVSEDDVLPIIVIGAFAGLRSAEIERLDWSEIHFAERFIEVKAGKAKTAARRVVPITDNLAAWLKPFENSIGPLWEHGHAYFHQRLRETAEATGTAKASPVELKDNGLRHSFISYRVAQTQNVNQVALEAGNSPAMIFKHYRELVTPKQAETWFGILPTITEVA